MKIYVADFGWAGNIVVVADNEAQARELMRDCPNYETNCELEVMEITEGLVIYNLGDM